MREKILEAAESLVQSRGLSAVTFQELADAVGLQKPSVFHHIKNKEELVLSLLERCRTHHAPKYAVVMEQDITAPEKLKQIAKMFEDGLKKDRPCLLAALAAGVESFSPRAACELNKAAERNIERFAAVFAQGREEGSVDFEGTPQHVAMGFYAMLQGLQSLCRAQGETRAFKKAAAAYINSITTEG